MLKYLARLRIIYSVSQKISYKPTHIHLICYTLISAHKYTHQ